MLTKMHFFFLRTLTIGLVICCLCTCIDPIEFDEAETPESGILIQGDLEVENGGRLRVGVYDVFQRANNQPRPLSGAVVVLEDEAGRSLTVSSSGDGTFFLDIANADPNFPLITNNKYRLRVTLPGPRVFESPWETLLPVPDMQNLSVERFERQEPNNIGVLVPVQYVNLRLDTDLRTAADQPRSRLLWEPEATYQMTDFPIEGVPPFGMIPDPKVCYCTRNILNDFVPVFDGNTAPNDTLQSYKILATPVDYRFAEGYYFVLHQRAISEQTQTYFSQLNQILARKGTIFDQPPGATTTNMRSVSDNTPVYGYFYVSQRKTKRLYVSPESMGNPAKRCPLSPSLSGEPGGKDSCEDCLIETRRSTVTKPVWWLQ
jgi:Domain of unknown function (DUF4249)